MLKHGERDLVEAFGRAIAQQQAPMLHHAEAMQPLTSALPAMNLGVGFADLRDVVRAHLDTLRREGDACAHEAATVVADNRDRAPASEAVPEELACGGSPSGAAPPAAPVPARSRAGRSRHSGARRDIRAGVGGVMEAPGVANGLEVASALFDAMPGVERPQAIDAALDQLPLHPARAQQLEALAAMLAQVDDCAAFLARDAAANSARHQMPVVGAVLALDRAALTGTYASPYAVIDGVVGGMLESLDGQRAALRSFAGVLDIAGEVLWVASKLARLYRPIAAPVAVIDVLVKLLSKPVRAMVACLDLAIFGLAALKFHELKDSNNPHQARALAGLLKQESVAAVKAAKTLRTIAQQRVARSRALRPGAAGLARWVRAAIARLPAAQLAAKKSPFARWQRRLAARAVRRDQRLEQAKLDRHLAAGGTMASYAEAHDASVARYERVGEMLRTAEHGAAHAKVLRQQRVAEMAEADALTAGADVASLTGALDENRVLRRQLARQALPKRSGRERDALVARRAAAAAHKAELEQAVAAATARPEALAEARASMSVTALTSRATAMHPDRVSDQEGVISGREVGRELKAFHGDDAFADRPDVWRDVVMLAKVLRERPLVRAPGRVGGDATPLADELEHCEGDGDPAATEAAWTPAALATAMHAAHALPAMARVVETYLGRHKSLLIEFVDVGDAAAALRQLDAARRAIVAKNQAKLDETQSVLGEQAQALQGVEPMAAAVALHQASVADAAVADVSIPEVEGGSWWQRALAFVRRKVRALAQATIGRVEQWVAQGVLSLATWTSREEFKGVLTGSASAVSQGQACVIDAGGVHADAVAHGEAMHGLLHEDEQAAFTQVLESRAAIAEAVELRGDVAKLQQTLPPDVADGASYVDAMRAPIVAAVGAPAAADGC